MSTIGVPNLKEIKTWESCLNIFVILWEDKEEKCEENREIFGTDILKNAETVYFNFMN